MAYRRVGVWFVLLPGVVFLTLVPSVLNFQFPGGPWPWALGMLILFCGVVLLRNRRRFQTFLAIMSLAALTLGMPAPALAANKLDRMIDNGATAPALAAYVFYTQNCKNCHTVTHDGKFGYTAQGRDRAQRSEGCTRILADMTVIAQLPGDQRSSEQVQKTEHFKQFGCTACHAVAPGKLDMTDVGAKLAHLHLGCVDVEKLLTAPLPR